MLKHRWASAALIRQSQDPGAFPFTPVTHVDILFPKGMRTSVGSSLTCLKHRRREIWAERIVKALESTSLSSDSTTKLQSSGQYGTGTKIVM